MFRYVITPLLVLLFLTGGIPIADASDGVEGFESGDLTGLNWVTAGDGDWYVTDWYAHDGSFSAISPDGMYNWYVAHLEITMNIAQNGDISFFLATFSEPRSDFLRFYIDDVEVGAWSGWNDWTEASFPVEAGTRTFRWTYALDNSLLYWYNAVLIDDVVFPPTTTNDHTCVQYTYSLGDPTFPSTNLYAYNVAPGEDPDSFLPSDWDQFVELGRQVAIGHCGDVVDDTCDDNDTEVCGATINNYQQGNFIYENACALRNQVLQEAGDSDASLGGWTDDLGFCD